MKRPVITLTTDFGTKDPFAGQMKGVILGINPDAEIVDITHEISPHSIIEGALVTGLSYNYFPTGSIHLAVIDPGVGSERRPIILSAGDRYFIGPDNGVFSMIYKREKGSFRVIHAIEERYFLSNRSSTFHGRDVFAPLAGWLSRGKEIEEFGKEISDYRTLNLPEASLTPSGTLKGKVIMIDRFGNASTNITSDLIEETFNKDGNIILQARAGEAPLKRYYYEPEGEGLYCIINSFGLLELFVKEGSATERFNISIGDPVEVKGTD